MCGKIKGRTFAYSMPQRCYIPKEYSSFPTISLKALFTNIIVDTHQGIDMAIFLCPGAYLNDEIPEDKFIILNIEGEFVDIMCKVNP